MSAALDAGTGVLRCCGSWPVLLGWLAVPAGSILYSSSAAGQGRGAVLWKPACNLCLAPPCKPSQDQQALLKPAHS